MRYIIFLFLLTLLGGCSEVIDVDMNTVDNSIVIYGYITSDEQYQKIEVSTSLEYQDTVSNPVISDAIVVVNDVYNYSYVDTLGYYLSDLAFKAEEGVDYTLKVSYDFDNDGTDEVYYASTSLADTTCIVGGHLVKSELMGIGYYTPYLTSAGLKGDEYWYVYFSSGDSLLVENLDDISIMQASSLISSEPSDYIPFMDMMNFNAMYFSKDNQEEILEMFDSTSNSQPTFLGVGDSIIVSVCTMEYGFYDFLTVLNKSSGSSNPIFGSGAVFLPTNFNEGVFGYFGSLNQKHVTIKVDE